MDPKMIELNNLRLLNDYLNQTIEVLVRAQRAGNGYSAGVGHSPFTAGVPGADVIPSPFAPSSYGLPSTSFAPAFGSLYGATYPTAYPTAIDPFAAQRAAATGGVFGAWQPQWTPITEVTRQAQLAQALAARQSVLETMCRVAGIV